MKITVAELVDKLDSVELTIGKLYSNDQVSGDVLNKAEEYLREYHDLLMDIRVEI